MVNDMYEVYFVQILSNATSTAQFMVAAEQYHL